MDLNTFLEKWKAIAGAIIVTFSMLYAVYTHFVTKAEFKQYKLEIYEVHLNIADFLIDNSDLDKGAHDRLVRVRGDVSDKIACTKEDKC